ncbi:hypothetical protein PFISCL1PPCAC_771, partial [Pristionchus fissidentatus]
PRLRMDAKPTLTNEEKKNGDQLSIFELLPVDILFIIMNFKPQPLGALLLTSKTLNASVHSFRSFPSHRPPVQSITISKNVALANRNEPCISLRIYRSREADERYQLVESPPDSYRLRHHTSKKEYKGISENDTEFLAKIKNDLGCELNLLNYWMLDNLETAAIHQLFDGMSIKTLSIHLTESFDSNRFLNFLLAKGVKSVEIHIANVLINNPVAFLLKLADICSAISIVQKVVETIPVHSHFLFGVMNVEWKEIFLGMFEKKLTLLSVVNDHYDSYLSQSSCHELIKTLASRDGNHIRFMATFCPISRSYSTRKWQMDNYDIEEEKNDRDGFVFKSWLKMVPISKYVPS